MTDPSAGARAGLRLRPVTADDAPLLRALFISSRPELLLLPLDADQLEGVITQQLAARAASYAALAGSHDRVIELDGRAIGRLYLAEVERSCRVVDVALLPEHRGQGIGTRVLAETLAEAGDRQVTLSVARGNPALRLYQRLGFAPVGGDEVFLFLERRP